ncbi:hypothetical protein [Ligilactobacillus saerimneri]|uniref:hypothetical protein n=1 Tax=Ligilactobacillus saerimneri TaxID=228229 RepID=UPI00041BF057|nr:hypothetical protein [Ligilactobacillus saerimneri]KRL73302.1 hypothetical protein FC54_GL000738 [Ligilactobacillus saerimneri DSM 16049]
MIFDIDKIKNSILVNRLYEAVKDEPGATKNEVISYLLSNGLIDGQGNITEKALEQTALLKSKMVKGAYQIALEQGVKTTLLEIASILISKGVITEDGQPTKKAFDLGLIDEEELHHD